MSSTVFGSLLSKWSRLNDARLQAVSSRNMYSEQGFEPLMGPSTGEVCHSLMVESYCTPGSALAHAALPIFSHRSRDLIVLLVLPSTRRVRFQSSSFCTALMKPFDIRTELLAFCPDTVK